MSKASTATVQTFFVWMLTYFFFLATLAGNLSASHDSINYLLHITLGDHLFHQHHLLYHFFARLWLNVFSFTGVEHYRIIESFTALWGSGVMSVCFLLLRNRFGLSPKMATAALVLILSCYGPWFYSVNIEVYMPPIFFLLLAFYRMSADAPGKNDVLLIALLHAAAILFHQANVLIIPTALFWIYKSFGNRGRMAITYLSIVILVTGAIYLAAGIVAENKHSFADMKQWLLGYTVGHNYWQPLSWHTPFRAAAGFGRALVGGQFMFQLPPVKALFETFFSNHTLNDEAYLTAEMPVPVAWILALLTGFVGVALVMLTAKFLLSIRKNFEKHGLIQLMLLTFTVYSVFFLFWMPEILEFWIFQLMLLLLMITGTISRTGAPFGLKPYTLTIALAITLFVVNYTGSMHWLRSTRYDWYYQQTLDLPAAAGDLVLIEDKWILKDYVRYFKRAEVMASDEMNWSESSIKNKIEEVTNRGGRVFINTEGPGGGVRWRIIRSY